MDVWISLRSTLAGLASKDAFSRLSSPVQCRRALPGGGRAPSPGAPSMLPPPTRITKTGGPSPGPLRRSRRLQQQNAAP